MSTKRKFQRAVALKAAREVLAALEPHTERLVVAGSLRRGCEQVGDVEILYIPRVTRDQGDLFGDEHAHTDHASEALSRLLQSHILSKRRNAKGHSMWGPQNKYAVHEQTQVPVDLFATTLEHWNNYLVCRTGPASLNTEIATRAKAKGWQWHPTGSGFEHLASGSKVAVTCEQDVFEFVGLPYLEPTQRT